MHSRILLINFTEKEAEKVRTTGLIVERGYLGDIKGPSKTTSVLSSYRYSEDDNESTVSDIDFCFPHPVYEYKAVFINLKKNETIKKEFEEKSRKLTEEDRKDFAKYWLLRGGVIVFFVGDYGYSDLHDLGIPDISLKKVVNNDIAINSLALERGKEMAQLFGGFKSDVIMPTHSYIQIEEKSSLLANSADAVARYLYWNNNNEDLGIFIDYNKDYSSKDRPRVLVLPQFKTNIIVVEGFLVALAKLYPNYLPEVPHTDWVESDEYYPAEVAGHDEKIQKVIDDAEQQVSDLKKEKENAKKKYESLRGILILTGDALKNSVLDVLVNIFKLQARDADKEKEGLSNEDIIVDFSDQKILMEVKGVKAENPSPLFIGQVWKHISQNKDKAISRGALVVNHDLQTNPKNRSLAYKGEQEKALEDIIFIDSRVMHDLGVAVIDHGLSPENAASLLLTDGRVSFNLKEHIKSTKQATG